jgi:hypothetical protein
LPRVGDALLAHSLDCIQGPSGLSIHSIPQNFPVELKSAYGPEGRLGTETKIDSGQGSSHVSVFIEQAFSALKKSLRGLNDW